MRRMRGGFSLIELTAVLLILAIAAAAVALHVAGPTGEAALDRAAVRVADFDRVTRTAARNQGRPMRIVIDPTLNRLERTDAQGRPAGAAASLPGRVRLSDVMVLGGGTARAQSSVLCSSRGLTPTYAVQLEVPEGRSRWLVFAGLSGQVTETQDREQVEAIFDAITP